VLRFRLGPFPVTVELSFLIVAVFLSRSLQPLEVLLWVLVVFVSVLVHELGHALVARALGGRPQIKLEGFGGVTFPLLPRRLGSLQQIALSVAGPFAGLSVGGIAWLLARTLSPVPGTPLAIAIGYALFTSVAWTILNLLPVLPLDGGHVMEAALTGIRGKPSARLAAWISVVTSVLVGLAIFWVFRDWLAALFFALFAGQNFARARALAGPPQPVPEEEVESTAAEEEDVGRITGVARQAMAAGDASGALAAAELLETSEGPVRQAAGLRIRAGVLLARGELEGARLAAGRSFALFPSADAAVVAARGSLRLGDRDAALTWLRRAIEAGAPEEAVRADPELGAVAGAG